MRVAVLGGGPAAGAAALALAGNGVATTLFLPERPGEKPCGGALPAYLLDELQDFDARSLPSVSVRRAVLENASGTVLELDLEGLRIYRRGDFDPALVDAATRAGAEVRRQKVRRLGWHGGRPVLDTDAGQWTFDWLIGADGARGPSRRSLGIEPVDESVGLGASIAGVEVDRLVLAFPDVADSYLWIFPRPGGCSVGIAYSESLLSAGAARACLRSFLQRHLALEFEELGGSRYRYPIPVYGPWVKRTLQHAAADRVLLVGDAAAVADPLTREGIRYAVRSARCAAEALIDGRPELYPDRLTAEIDADLARAARARRYFYAAPLGQWMVPVCRRHPGIRRVLADLLGCAQPYVGLRRRLIQAAFDLRRRSGSPSGHEP